MTLTERPAVGVASDYALSQRELDEFRTNGYLVIRNAIDEASLKRFADAARTHPPVDQILPGQQWPGPGRYTLARNAMADPDMAFLMKRPEIVDRMYRETVKVLNDPVPSVNEPAATSVRVIRPVFCAF